MQYAPTAIYEIDFTGPRFTNVNDAMCIITGCSREELLVANPFDFLEAESLGRFNQRIKKALAGETIDENVEYQAIAKGGRQLWVTLNMKFKRQNGQIYGAQVVAHDVTERKRAEQELRRAKNDWERTFDSVPDFIAILDNDHRIVRVNLAMAQQLGVTTEKAVGLLCYNCVHGLENSPDFCPHAQTIKDGKEHTAEVHEPRLGGDFLVSTTPLRNEKGHIIGSVHVARNITERKKIETSLQTSMNRLYSILSNMHGSILLVSDEGRVEFANQSFCDYFGFKESPSEIKGLSSDEVLKKINNIYRFPGKEIARIKDLVSQGKIVTGEEVPMQGNKTCMRDFIPLYLDEKSASRLWHHIDITERKQMEDKLTEYAMNLEALVEERTEEVSSERQRLYNVLETLPAYVVLLDNEYRVPFANKVFRELFGDSCGRRCYEFLFNRDSPCDNCETYKVLKNNKPHHWEWTGPNGRDYDIYDFPFDEPDGSTRILEMGLDITERKRAEISVKSERKRLFDVLETVPIMVCLLSPDYHVVFANRSFRQKFGESKGRHCYEYCFGYMEPCSFYESYIVLRTGQPHHWQVNGQEGSVIDAYDFPFTDADGSPLILEMDIDITPQKKAEADAQESAKKLKNAERLAAIGATAGIVGHDIRNPLQAIIGDLYLAKEELVSLPESDEKNNTLESLTEIEKNIDYINKIVADLQDFARPLKPHVGETDLKCIIDELLSKNSLPENINVSVEVGPETGKIVVDSTYINRILYNLITNAVQAMPKGGQLTIHAFIDKKTKEAVLTVEDTGVGIPENIKDKLFTPMFTTKSKGQGFGLAVVKRMTESLGGTVSFESKEGKGTKFTVRLNAHK